MDALDYDLKAIEAERIRAEQSEAGLRASVSQHGLLLESLQLQYDNLVLERDNLAAAKQQYQDTIAQCESREADARQAYDQTEAQVAACRAAIDKLAAEATDNTAQAASLQTEIAENRSEAASEARALADLEQLKAELDAGVSGTTDTIEGFEAEIACLTEELAHAEATREDTGTVTARLNEQIAAQMNQHERVEGERARVDREAQGKNDEILNLEREAARLENQGVPARRRGQEKDPAHPGRKAHAKRRGGLRAGAHGDGASAH